MTESSVDNRVVVGGVAVEDSVGWTAVEGNVTVEDSVGRVVELDCTAKAFAGVEDTSPTSSLLSTVPSVVVSGSDGDSTGGDNSVSMLRFDVEGVSNLSTSADATSSATSSVLSTVSCLLLSSKKAANPFGW